MSRSNEALDGTLLARMECSCSLELRCRDDRSDRSGAEGRVRSRSRNNRRRYLSRPPRAWAWCDGSRASCGGRALERTVAIKLIRPELLDKGDLRERFLSEARAMARVYHPNVLPIYALGEHEGMPYFISEFVEGQTGRALAGIAALGTGPDIDLAYHILEGTCRGRGSDSRGRDGPS